MASELPRRLHLPSGAVVELSAKPRTEPAKRAPGAPLFSEIFDLDLTLSANLEALPLGDFHVLRAVLIKAGLVAEEPISIACANCGEPIPVRACESLEIAPWVDGELGDPELDRVLPFGEPHAIAPIPLGRVRTARTVTLEPRTVADARALFEALGREGELVLTPEVVQAMGIRALGREEDPARIAEALAAASEEAFDTVAEVFLASHYVPRLASVVFCPKCRARSDVDAPYERELELGPTPARAEAAAEFPPFDAFADRARAFGEPLLAEVPGEEVVFVVDEGTPAVDEGGVPLLGAYDPPYPGDASAPSRPPTVTIWYRSFREEHAADPTFDWEGELQDTIEHELEHHVYFLRGDDPMDADERAVIRDEARRIIGRREAERRALEGFGRSFGEFVRRTWPIWVLTLLAVVLAYLAEDAGN